jgi:hypothetical protein
MKIQVIKKGSSAKPSGYCGGFVDDLQATRTKK